MTDERMASLAKQSLAMGKTELRSKGNIEGIFASYFERHGLHRMRGLEKLIVEVAGPDWLNDPRKKERAFAIMCYANSIGKPDAMAFVSIIDRWDANAAFLALPDAEKDRVFDENPKNPDYFSPHDWLMSSVQTLERLCMSMQRIRMPGALLVGEIETRFWNQSEFSGNLKLFGEPPVWISMAMEAAPAALRQVVANYRRHMESSS